MAIAFVNRVGQNADNVSGAALVVTVGVAGAAQGNKLIVGYAWSDDGTSPVPTCVDSKGNIYTAEADMFMSANGNKRLVTFSSVLATALVNGDTITCTCSPAQVLRAMDILQFSGVGKTRDRITQRQLSTSTTPTTLASELRRKANEVVVGFCCWRRVAGTDTLTAGAGYLAANTVVTASGFLYLATEYQIFAVTGTDAADGVLPLTAGWIMTSVGYCEPGVSFGQSPVAHPSEFADMVGLN